MLKIENYNKILGLDVGRWYVGEIFETSNAYLIQLWTTDNDKMQVNLEKIPVGRQIEYELWCWNKQNKYNGVKQTATPIRTMLKSEKIKDIDYFLASMRFLIKDL